MKKELAWVLRLNGNKLKNMIKVAQFLLKTYLFHCFGLINRKNTRLSQSECKRKQFERNFRRKTLNW